MRFSKGRTARYLLFLRHRCELQGIEMTLHKMHGLANPIDLVTEHLKQHMAKIYFESSDMWTEGCRAEIALSLEPHVLAPSIRWSVNIG